jgi:DNA-binding XRE family transcriptional regulator
MARNTFSEVMGGVAAVLKGGREGKADCRTAGAREMTELGKILGERIKQKRTEKRIGQEYMGERLGISQSAYSRIEVGGTNVTVLQLCMIAGILETRAQWFIPEVEFKPASLVVRKRWERAK